MALTMVLCKVLRMFEFVDKIPRCDLSNESFIREQYFPVVLFMILYKVVPIFKSVDEIPMCDHSHESY